MQHKNILKYKEKKTKKAFEKKNDFSKENSRKNK